MVIKAFRILKNMKLIFRKTRILKKSPFMQKERVSVVFFLYILLTGSPGIKLYSQVNRATHYFSYHSTYSINDSLGGIQCKIAAEGQTFDQDDAIYFPYNSLNGIGEPQIEIMKSNGKWKLLNEIHYQDTEVELNHFYADQWIRTVNLPARSLFRVVISYHIPDIFLIPQIPLSSPYDLDSLMVTINYPSDYSFSYRFWNLDNPGLLRTDSLQTDTRNTFFLCLKPAKVPPSYLFAHPESNQIRRFPSITTLIVPPSFKGQEDQYLNAWYMKLNESINELSESSREQLLGMTCGIEDKDSIITMLSNTLKERIKYLDVEIGLGSLRPSDPNETLQKLQGDCKDMSYLLCSALRLHGIDARMAIASTWSNNADLVLPVISGGNHAVVAVKRRGKWLIIDLTEKFGDIRYPGRAIQKRHLYITGEDKGQILKIEPVAADSNQINWEMDLHQQADGLVGSFRVKVRGLPMNKVREIVARTPVGSNAEMQSYLNAYSDELVFDAISTTEQPGYIEILGMTRTISNPLTANMEDHYLWKNFIPYPHPFPRMIRRTPMFNESTLLQTMDLKLTLDQPVAREFQSHFNEHNSFSSFESGITSNGDHSLHFNYILRMDELEFGKPDVEEYNAFNHSLNSYFKHVVIFQ